MPRAVFTYGTLAFPEVMEAVTGSAFESHEGWIRGFARFGVRDAVYPGVVVCDGEITPGRVYHGVGAATLRRLDRFEDWLYERRPVRVESDGAPDLEADAWIVPARFAEHLAQDPWDPEWFRRQHLTQYLDGCRRFFEEDRAGRDD